jgi:hypothetical protein
LVALIKVVILHPEMINKLFIDHLGTQVLHFYHNMSCVSLEIRPLKKQSSGTMDFCSLFGSGIWAEWALCRCAIEEKAPLPIFGRPEPDLPPRKNSAAEKNEDSFPLVLISADFHTSPNILVKVWRSLGGVCTPHTPPCPYLVWVLAASKSGTETQILDE